MKKVIRGVMASIVICLCVSHMSAQYPVLCTVNQPDMLMADAGSSQSVISGTVLQLGGNPVATGGSPPYHYTWSPASGLNDTTLPNPTLTADSTITYTLEVRDADGCIASSSVHISILIGISEAGQAQESYSVFPNPSSTRLLFVETKKVTSEPIEITMLRISGEVVFNATFIPSCSAIPIDLAGLSPGVYVMRIAGADVQYHKIVLQ